MTALDPEVVERATQAHYEAWSLNAAETAGVYDAMGHNRFMTQAVIDAVAADIARAERDRVLRLLAEGLSPSARKSLAQGAYWVRLGSHEAHILLAAAES